MQYPNRMARPSVPEQLQTLVMQYKSEMELYRQGGPQAEYHLQRANQIKDYLSTLSRNRQQLNANAPQTQSPAMQAAQPHQQPPQPQQYEVSPQQLAQSQARAAAGQQGAMANMQIVNSFQQRQKEIEDLRGHIANFERQLQTAMGALRTVENEETRQRLTRSIQILRNKRDQCRQREQQATMALQAAREKLKRRPMPGQPGQPGTPGQPQPPAGPAVQGVGPQAPAQPPVSGQPGVPGMLPGAQQTPVAAQQQTPGAAGAPVGPGVRRQVGSPQPSANRTGLLEPIPSSLHVNPSVPVSVPRGRATLISGGASGASALNTPALTRIPPFEVGGDRVLSKRRLNELIAGILGEDSNALFDGDVEELLLDLADEFVTSVTTFACRLAKHRKSDTLEAKDVQMHLERNWNLRIPGYSSDEVRSIRKAMPAPAYQQKVQGVNMSKSVNK